MKKYNIADVTFEIDMDFSVKEEEAFKEFKTNKETQELYKFIPIDNKNIIAKNKIYESPIYNIYTTYKGFVREYRSIYKLKTYAYLEENKNIVYYDRNQMDLVGYMFCIMELIGIELALCKHKTFILHSSYINYKNKAILFSGPSGIGKSTQASLWQQYENAEIVNGDRSAINKNNGNWCAYGLPFAGSSKIYKNKTLPIKAVVILRQSKTNFIRKLDMSKAFKLIYSEVTVNTWNKEYINEILELVYQFVQEIPVYILSCLPDKSALNLLREELEGETENAR